MRERIKHAMNDAGTAYDAKHRGGLGRGWDPDDEALDAATDAVLATIAAQPGEQLVTIERKYIDRLREDLDAGNGRSAMGHARYIVDRAVVPTIPPQAPPDGIAGVLDEARRVGDVIVESDCGEMAWRTSITTLRPYRQHTGVGATIEAATRDALARVEG